MKKIIYRLSSLAAAGVLTISGLAGCGSSSSSSSSSADTENDGNKINAPTYESSEEGTQSERPSFNDWEVVEPAEDDMEYDLGSYVISPDGIKLYFDEEEYPRELVLTLEKYFLSIEERDYEKYKECIFPSYIDRMEEHLQKEYKYGLDTSFNTQCDNLEVKGGEGYSITRIKVEPPLEGITEEEGIDAFLDNLDSFFGAEYKYKDSVKADSDSLRYMSFHVMAQDKNGEETLLLSEFYILFAEKDGKYYTFG